MRQTESGSGQEIVEGLLALHNVMITEQRTKNKKRKERNKRKGTHLGQDKR
jgi:hypothetical protein